MSNWKKYTMGALLACMPLAMVGCGSDDAAVPTPTPTPSLKEITGKAVLGPISSATVNVYGVDAKGKKLATPLNTTPVKTDGKGNYKIKVPQASTGTVIFEVVGGDYIDEATNTKKTNTTLSSAVSEIGTAQTVAVTAITDLSVKLVQKNYSSGGFTPKNVLSGITAAKTLLSLPASLDIVTTLPVPAAEVTSAATSDQLAYMSAVATISELQKVNTATTTDTIADTVATATKTGGSTTALNAILGQVQAAFDAAVLKIQTTVSTLPGAATLTAQLASISSIKSAPIKTDVTQVTDAIKDTVAAVVSDTTPPTVPTGLAAPSPTATAVTLTWTASTDPANTDGKPGSGVAGYYIFRDNAKVGTSATTSFTDTTVAASKSYSYTVVAFDKAGNPALDKAIHSAALPVTTPAASTGPVVPNLNITASGIVKP